MVFQRRPLNSAMSQTKVDFATLAWDETTAHVRLKAFEHDGRKLRLVEFMRGFVEHDWCTKGHTGYVLAGEMEIAFANRTEKFEAGDGLMIAGGDSQRHKVNVTGSLVRLILFEDL